MWSVIEAVHSAVRHVCGPELVHSGRDELVALCLVRDGQEYVKTFIEHHLALGVKHIVFLDNASVDETVSVARDYEDVTILYTELPFKEYMLEMRRYLIERFGRDRWSLFLDVDELFDYPYSDTVAPRALLQHLNERPYTAVAAQMLDMFPQEPLSRRTGEDGRSYVEAHRYYDISNVRVQDYHSVFPDGNVLADEEISVLRDGIRRTLFDHRSVLTKHPLIFFDGRVRPMVTAHRVGGAHVADFTCVLYHYKFLGRFYEQAARAVEEENYYNNSVAYKKYHRVLEQNSKLRIKRSTSRELEDVEELIESGFLVVSRDYLNLVGAQEDPKDFPEDPRELRALLAEGRSKARSKSMETGLAERRLQACRQRLGKLKGGGPRGDRKVRRLRERNRRLSRQLEILEDQIGEMQSSRAWRLVAAWDAIRARLPGRRP